MVFGYGSQIRLINAFLFNLFIVAASVSSSLSLVMIFIWLATQQYQAASVIQGGTNGWDINNKSASFHSLPTVVQEWAYD